MTFGLKYSMPIKQSPFAVYGWLGAFSWTAETIYSNANPNKINYSLLMIPQEMTAPLPT